ncbi:MAG TPA: hypothetical protein VLT58_13865 [Polyangia bacterium]|nr:hypothetical protein [Polyangia bacterium]
MPDSASTPDGNDIANRFTYHPPFGDQPARYERIRAAGLDLAGILSELCPTSRELSLALTNLDQVVMWANASIARNEKPETSS